MTGKKYIIILCIIIMISSHYYIPDNHKKQDVNAEVAMKLSMEARQIIASLIWLKIDYYHHTSVDRKLFNAEILPLMKLSVLLDPYFVRAYTTLAFHLSTYYNKEDEALKLLKKGIEYNKTSPLISELYGETGKIELIHNHNTKEAELYFTASVNNYTLNCDIDDYLINTLYLKYILESENKIVPEYVTKIIEKINKTEIDNLFKNNSLEEIVKNEADSDKKKIICDDHEHCHHDHHHHDDEGKQLWNRKDFSHKKKRTNILFFIAFIFSIYFFRFRQTE